MHIFNVNITETLVLCTFVSVSISMGHVLRATEVIKRDNSVL